MDFCRNVPVSGGSPSEHPSQPCSLDDLFPAGTTEDDLNIEWLSIFVEDCLSSSGSGNCIPPPTNVQSNNLQASKSSSQSLLQQNPSLPEFVIPGKARSKRKRALTAAKAYPSKGWSDHSDPPLLHQAYWLADSELIVPKKEEEEEEEEEEGGGGGGVEEMVVVEKNNDNSSGNLEGGLGQPRRCTHCLAQRTPQWRAGPLGPKTLCNACGVRFKSGRLLPEYRPAKSPTFVSYKHSNSHKKVMEMRMSILSSVPTSL